MIHENAPAKFNRFLSVLGRREDGFHLLELITTVLHDWPSLHDELTADTGVGLSLEIDGPTADGLKPDDSNLVLRAWRLLERESKRTLPAKIKLHKRIPCGAGLGGGSSDAAAALRAGNNLYNLGLPTSTLLSLGAELGSDVPLFLLGGTVLGLDIGQRVFPLRDIPLPPMLITYPHLHVSTPSVYKALTFKNSQYNLQSSSHDSKETRTHHSPPATRPFSSPSPSLSPNEAPPWRNDLTDAALTVCPALYHVRDALVASGGVPMLCGSGSCWAARFDNTIDRDRAVKELSAQYDGWLFYTEQKT